MILEFVIVEFPVLKLWKCDYIFSTTLFLNINKRLVMHFRVAVGEYFPFLILKMDNSQIQMTGPLAEAFQILANRANFTYSLLRAEGDVWGSLGPNGWTGLLGMLARNEVDFALGPFTMSYSRWKAFPMFVQCCMTW
ncbi:hypothetical protein JTE90_009849 [Oedothorax gibbosus]|uniref:Ionotropic glutamate receptor L-glutamate and glycine-binding domain-containing protein n=1 Tax=Oedothorax gibbosus TaxID=931172 RepID=A0AAV6TYN0_9ARAC|nr:hypothetical protein JTE90_009849 [Oedothorax gibbosus]